MHFVAAGHGIRISNMLCWARPMANENLAGGAVYITCKTSCLQGIIIRRWWKDIVRHSLTSLLEQYRTTIKFVLHWDKVSVWPLAMYVAVSLLGTLFAVHIVQTRLAYYTSTAKIGRYTAKQLGGAA